MFTGTNFRDKETCRENRKILNLVKISRTTVYVWFLIVGLKYWCFVVLNVHVQVCKMPDVMSYEASNLIDIYTCIIIVCSTCMHNVSKNFLGCYPSILLPLLYSHVHFFLLFSFHYTPLFIVNSPFFFLRP